MTRRRSTAHVIGKATICGDHCCHYLRLKIDCSLNLLLTEIFKRRIYVVDEPPFVFEKVFALETCRLNHLLNFSSYYWHFHREPCNQVNTENPPSLAASSSVNSEIRPQSPTTPAPGHTSIPTLAHSSHCQTVLTPTSWSSSPNSFWTTPPSSLAFMPFSSSWYSGLIIGPFRFFRLRLAWMYNAFVS